MRCVIQCSNIYADKDGKEVVSPVEYETLGLLGTNCGLSDPDDLAQMNHIANDLGVDTIEVGAMIAVLMEAGLGAFGDLRFMADCFAEIRNGSEKGRIWAQGTARVGEHYGVKRVPVIKKQAISAYDPRVVEATGITMMATAQGADHTAGNLPRLKTREMETPAIVEQSVAHQARVAANDSLGLCIFGMSVTNPNTEWLTDTINAAHGTSLTQGVLPRPLAARPRSSWSTSSTSGPASPRRTTSCPRSSTRRRSPTNHVARFHAADEEMYERLPA
jgi:aldehyde:ferredoxin oxidoreductase